MSRARKRSVGNPLHDECFPPIAARNATTLILGSLPGRKSLQMQQYYAHPQNAFWKIVARVFEAEPTLPYARRVRLLKEHQIALWDVLAAAERPGSLDSDIVTGTAAVNDFGQFFRTHQEIRRVFFNGRKAEQLYQRRVLPTLGVAFQHIEYRCLPSTSPAHAGMSFAAKLAQWKVIARP
jgi:TDG/mug DNA glycosylase family protein